MDVATWLKELGLEQYADRFAENDIDATLLAGLSGDDLKEIGVASLGHRKRLLEAIESLGAYPAAGTIARPEAPSTASEAERRQLTVMFVDLVGSTALSGALDVEDYREVMSAYQDACAAVVTRYDGHVAKFLGDGILVYFGYPTAHEDDAERALRAGIELLDAVSGLETKKLGEPLQARIGVATGLVVAGDLIGERAKEDHAVLGETPNIAARLQALAEPGSVVVSGPTARLVEGLFEVQDLGPQNLKGVAEPVPAFRVIGESDAPSRFEATAGRGLTQLVGRSEEISLLMKRWRLAQEGDGQTVLLSGEPGVGKSRILRAFRDDLESEPHNRVLYYGSPYHLNSAFYPVVDQLERAIRAQRTDTREEKRRKLETTLGSLGLPVDKVAPPLAALLSVADESRDTPLGGGPEQIRARITAAIIAILASMAGGAPVLMVVEDAHWIDPSTLDLLRAVIDWLPGHRVLLIVTHRPEFGSDWAADANLTRLTLNRLGRQDAEAIVKRVAGEKALSDDEIRQIVERGDGVPIFIEELTKTVLEAREATEGDGAATATRRRTAAAIPASLHDSLMARLDRLGPVKEVAQLAATIGRDFDLDLLAAASPLSATEIDAAVEKLCQSGLVHRRGPEVHRSFEFKHALVRDAAYESLLKSVRRQCHLRVAEALSNGFADLAEAQPEILAHHYGEAGRLSEAVQLWIRAAQKAMERGANTEVVAHCARGLELVGLLPEGKEREAFELRLHLTQGAAVVVLKGNTAPEVRDTYGRAAELAARVGTEKDRFSATWGLWIYTSQNGMHHESSGLVDKLLDSAAHESDSGLELQAHHTAWTTRFALDDLPAVMRHIERGKAIYDIGQHGDHAFHYGGHDPGVCCYAHGALALWQMGYPEKATKSVRDGAALSEVLDHTVSKVIVNCFRGMLLQHLGHTAELSDEMETMKQACVEYGFPHYLAIANILQGWATSRRGGAEAGIEMIESALAPFRDPGRLIRLTYYLTLLADAQACAGRHDDALKTLDEALDLTHRTGEQRWLSDILRMKAEQLYLTGAQDAGRTRDALFEALEVARRHSAKSFELRIAAALKKLEKKSAEKMGAEELLSDVYGWFSEGQETHDLKMAASLIGPGT